MEAIRSACSVSWTPSCRCINLIKLLSNVPIRANDVEKIKFTTVDDYLISLPAEAREKLIKMRETIRKAAPKAEESISYGMPAFKQDGIICWYAAARNHYALYIVPALKNVFNDKLADYSQTKSAVHFSYDDPVPVRLITEIVKYKVKVNSRNPKTTKKK